MYILVKLCVLPVVLQGAPTGGEKKILTPAFYAFSSALSRFLFTEVDTYVIACRPRDVTLSCILMSLRERPFSQASLHGVDRRTH